MDVQKNKSIIAVCPVTLTDVHSLARPNELLSYVSICCLSMTWVHCVPFLLGSFTHYHTASIFSGALAVNEQWRRYRRTYENVCILVQKRTDKDVSMPTHRPRECESLRAATSYLSERRTFKKLHTNSSVSCQLLHSSFSLSYRFESAAMWCLWGSGSAFLLFLSVATDLSCWDYLVSLQWEFHSIAAQMVVFIWFTNTSAN